MKPTQNLRQAVSSYKAGKADAFTVLYEESSRYIYTCIYNVMQGNDNAEDIISDIMQDTYVEISRNIGQLKDEDNFLSWAGSIATRKCYAWLKKNNRYVLLNEEDDTFDNLADSDNIIPEAVMQSREKQRLVKEIIDTQLTQMQKLCIIAYYYNEQKQAEIAQELGIPENTVKTNLSRAKAKIKDGVLDIEKKQGTKLYSVAPLLLFLFREEISACVVPHTITVKVNASVSITKGAGTKTLLEKLASASAKAKITAGIIGVGAAVAVGSAVYVALQDNGGSWEKEYRKILTEDDNAVGFDLNDFEEDGIPELVILEEDGSVTLCSYKEGEEPSVSSLKAGEERGDERHNVLEQNHYGYDLEYGRLINLMDVSVSVDGSEADHLTVPIYIQYLNGKCGNSEKASYGYTVGIYPVVWAYFWGDANQYEISEEEAMEHLAEAQARFNEITYTDITEKAIEERFKEFNENGNRDRIRNSVAETPAQAGNEAVEILDPFSVSETETALSDKEQDSLEMLLRLTALSDYFLGNGMTGTFHNSEDMQTTMRFIDMASCFGVNETVYANYLPPMEIDENTYARYFEKDDIQAYLKNVFDIEAADLSAYLENGKIVCSLIGDPIPTEVNVGRVTAVSDGTYKISGTVSIIEAEGDWTPYPFLMTVAPNSESPFGFTMKYLHYGSDGSINLEAEQSEMILQMALAAEHACISHWQMTEDFDIYPEEMNILSKFEYAAEGFRFKWAGDGKESATAEELAQLYEQVTGEHFSREELDHMFEEMQAENSNYVYKGTDYENGIAKLYVQLNAYYGSGIYDRYDIAEDQYTYDNRIISYSGDGQWVIRENKTEKFYDDYIAVSGVSITYDVPFTIFLYVDSNSPTGYRLHYIHYYVSNSSILGAGSDAFAYEQPISISMPYGRYKSNGGAELEFYNDGTVRVKEGNVSHVYNYTIDSEGNIVINPENEAVEGKYNSAADELIVENIKFRR